MKSRLLKIVPLFLIALLVAGGVLAGLPGEAEAAKKVTYRVRLMDPGTPWDRLEPRVNMQNNESPQATIVLINNESQPPALASNEGTTFDLVVDTKLKTKKVKIAGQKVEATYYKVQIPAKSYRVPVVEYWSPMGELRATMKMKGNAKGMLYVTGGDVDLYTVVKKKGKTKIGDGTVDPAGSLLIQMQTEIKISVIETGKAFMKTKSKSYMTTGKASLVVQGSKTKLDGMRLPESDPSGLLGTPMAGVPLDLEAGTGTLVTCAATMKGKSALGRTDSITAQVWTMELTGPPMVLAGAPGVPGKAEGVRGGTYQVLVMNPGTPWDRMNPKVNNESPTITLNSNNLAPVEGQIDAGERMTFALVVDGKLKKTKVKIAGQKVEATYQKVKIPKKSYIVPVARYESPMGTVVVTQTLKSDAKGKLYITNGDVDVSQVIKKKAKTKIGDGTADPAGSLLIKLKTELKIVIEETGEKFMGMKTESYLTTGMVRIVVQGSDSPLEGLALPKDDRSGLLTTPLVGVPLDLEAGTGTLVGISGFMNMKSALGRSDSITLQVRVLDIQPR